MQTTFTIKRQPNSNFFECIDRRGLRCIFEVNNFEKTAYYTYTKSVNPDKVKGMIKEMEEWLKKYQSSIVESPKPLAETIVNTLIARRKELGFSQYKIAEITGIKREAITRLEKTKSINMATLEKLLKGLDLNIVFL